MDNPVHAFVAMVVGVSALLLSLFCQGCYVSPYPDPVPVETVPGPPLLIPEPTPNCGDYDPNAPDGPPCTDIGGRFQCDVWNYGIIRDTVPVGSCHTLAGDKPPPCTLWLYCYACPPGGGACVRIM